MGVLVWYVRGFRGWGVDEGIVVEFIYMVVD